MTTSTKPEWLELTSLVGETRLATGESDCVSYAVDGKVPQCVVTPATAQQVADVLAHAASRRLAVIPCRNGTMLDVGNPPQRYDIALSLREMNHVRYYEPADLTVSVEPGMKLADFQDFVGCHGLWLPIDPPGGLRASIGGILASNSSGPLRLRYGGPRDMVLGMKIATPEGKIIKSGGRVVKNVAGYDLTKFLIGSYGTLGVIVEANLKLYPRPPEQATFVFHVKKLEAAQTLRRKVLDSPISPLRMMLLDDHASLLIRKEIVIEAVKGEYELWIEAGGTRRVIERIVHELETIGNEQGLSVERLGKTAADRAWSRISDFRTWLLETHPGAVILKALLPIAVNEGFLALARREAGEGAAWVAGLSQNGVGVSHVCLTPEQPTPDITRLISRLRHEAVKSGGALVLEHCPTEIKAQIDVWGDPGDDFEMMRKLKLTWDPKGTLAPGRFMGRI